MLQTFLYIPLIKEWKIQHACSLELVIHSNIFGIFLVLKNFSSNGEETNSSCWRTWVSISTSLYLKAGSTLAGIMSSWFWEKSMCHCHPRNFRSVRERPVRICSVYNASSSWWNYKEHDHFFAIELYYIPWLLKRIHLYRSKVCTSQAEDSDPSPELRIHLPPLGLEWLASKKNSSSLLLHITHFSSSS
jgi:hypothetical protein